METIILLGIGLSMDALAVTIANTLCYKKNKGYILVMALLFGIFQGLMPLLGFYAGSLFISFIKNIDHWLALILLCAIGINMIKESIEEIRNNKGLVCDYKILTFKTLIIQAIATSIDALAVGISLTASINNIYLASFIIFLTTFIICIIGGFIGEKVGLFIKDKAGIFGGLVLIFIGIKIFVEHVFGL